MLMDEVRESLRARHYAERTEKAYCLWVRRYIRFHGLRHPAEMGERGSANTCRLCSAGMRSMLSSRASTVTGG